MLLWLVYFIFLSVKDTLIYLVNVELKCTQNLLLTHCIDVP